MSSSRERVQKHYYKHRETQIAKHLYTFAKKRSRLYNIEFNITEDDIFVPTTCPITGLELKRGQGKIIPNSPTLDRVDNSLGYVPGNVRVISNKANRQKGDLTRAEVERLLQYMDGKL